MRRIVSECKEDIWGYLEFILNRHTKKVAILYQSLSVVEMLQSRLSRYRTIKYITYD